MVRTAEQYHALMRDVSSACGSFMVLAMTVSDEDLAAAIATVDKAEAVGHLLDPTLYRARLVDDGLARQKRLLTAFATFRAELAALGVE